MSDQKIYIIPLPISESALEKSVPTLNLQIMLTLRHFVTENIKTARRFLRKAHPNFPIDSCLFYELDKHNDYSIDSEITKALEAGLSLGLMSESGYPGVADPGNKLIRLAHQQHIQVVPLVGPSSVIMALAASGLNGQYFTFRGYLSNDNQERTSQLNDLQKEIQKTGATQIFIETPFRNQRFFLEILDVLDASLKLCVAMDITGTNEFIVTKKISEWKTIKRDFSKLPAIFLLGK